MKGVEFEKKIKKCVKCGELDWMFVYQNLCDECQKEMKKKHKSILEI